MITIKEHRRGTQAVRIDRLKALRAFRAARVRSHSLLGPEGHMGHLITNALPRPFLHLLFPTSKPRRESQLNYCSRD
jgi:hypothetical protein